MSKQRQLINLFLTTHRLILGKFVKHDTDVEYWKTHHRDKLADLGRQTFVNLINTAIAYGELDLSGLSEKEELEKAYEFGEQYSESEDSFCSFVYDHRSDILDEARNLVQRGKNNLALVHYAMWWEHWINYFIHLMLQRKGFTTKEFNDVIKSLNNRDKSSWLLKLLDLPPIESAHFKVIGKLAEKRNQFVHYKYPIRNIDEHFNDESPLKIESIEDTIEYFRAYEHEHIYGNCKLFGCQKE